MKYFLLFFILVSFSFSKQDHIIAWNEKNKLAWKDFTYVSKDTIYFEEDAMASVWLNMKSFYNPHLNFSIKAVFDKDKSLTIDTVSNELLQHEQGHFDLCELYARKLRKTFDSLLNNGNSNMDLYKKEFGRINMEHISEQNKYDSETNHSTNVIEQKRWNLYIKEKLLALERYKNTIVLE